MRFAATSWLPWIAAAPILFAASWYGLRRGREALAKFAEPELLRRLVGERVGPARIRSALLVAAAAALIVAALARPQFGVKPVVVQRSGIDLVVALDVSKSMAARDIRPDRFHRAALEIGRIIDALEGNRIGLVTFAGRAFVECPLTYDAGTLRLFLDSIRVGSIPDPGTDLPGALSEGVRMLGDSKARSKVVLLVTDGENLGDAVDPALAQAAAAHVLVFTVGIGSTEGAPVPEVDETGRVTGYKSDADGERVISRLDAATLQRIADATGGVVYLADDGKLNLDPLIARLNGLEKSDIASQEFTEYEERYRYPAALALVLLLVDVLLMGGRGRTRS